MSEENDASNHQRTEQEATDWLARLRGGDPADRGPFEDWHCADPLHADTYDRVLASWQATQGLVSKNAVRATPTALAVRGRRDRRGDRVRFAWLRVARRGTALARGTAARVRSRAGEIRTLALSDGSRVTLDTATTVRASYMRAERRVWVERGRARFDRRRQTHHQ